MRAASWAAAAAAVTVLAACGGAAQPAAQSADARVCQHYQTQRAWVKNLATPTLADALQFESWVALDARQATPGTPVARDLAALSAAQQDPAGDVHGASVRVLRDCAELGVTFAP